MEFVDQRGMLWRRLLDRLARCFGQVERDRDDLEAVRLQLFTQFLPDRQVPATPSPTGPREQKDFLPAKTRE